MYCEYERLILYDKGETIMNLYMVRHGETEWNNQRKIQGRADTPLNEIGKKQALETRDKLSNIDIDLIICSPLVRAKQTAEIINSGRKIDIIYDDRITERSFGKLEGHSINDYNFNEFWDYYKNVEFEDIETMHDLFNRVYRFLDDIISKYNDKNILIVSHGGVGVPVYCYFNNSIPTGSLFEAGLQLKNCEVKKYEIK